MRWLFRLLRTLMAFVLAVVALLLTAAIVVLLKPDWRTQAIDRGLESATGWKWSFEATKVGWNHFAADGVFVIQGAQGVQAEHLDFRIETLRMVREQALVVESGSIDGALIDLSTIPPAALGLTREQLRYLPAVADRNEAADLLVEAALGRFAAQGVPFELSNLTVSGSALLPEGRGFEFVILIDEANSAALQEARWTVKSATFH